MPTCRTQPAPPAPVELSLAPLTEYRIQAIQDILGRGYRAYEDYANQRSTTQPLFDFSDEDSLLSLVDVVNTPAYDSRFFHGKTQKEYFKSISAKLSLSGSYEGFSGEVTASFDWKDEWKRQRESFNYMDVVSQYRLTVKDHVPLMPQVKKDIDSALSPKALFDKYGTHYLRAVLIGGRVSFMSHFEETSQESSATAELVSKVAYKKMFEASASGKSEIKEKVTQAMTNRTIKVTGGDAALRVGIRKAKEGAMSDTYAQWAASLEENPAIADFVNGGLLPLYTLAEDPRRQQVLKNAWETYLEDHYSIVDVKAPSAIKRNAKVKLVAQDGRYLAKAYSGVEYYYATLTASGSKAMVHQLAGDNASLVSGNNISIKTTEAFKNTFWAKWSKRTYLGAFTASTLYYWDKYGSKTNWIIERADGASGPIYYGDEVTIRNEHYSKQYLQPAADGYLTTKTARYTFRFERG